MVMLFMVAPAFAGEDPYIAVVGNDINANPFYLSPKYEQFLYDAGIYGGLGGEAYSANSPQIQPEICDTEGIATYNGQLPGPPFTYRGNVNAKVTAGNEGWFEWTIALPKKPSGEINLCIQCGVLKPDAFKLWGFQAVLACAAETGERVESNCTREEVWPGESPVIKYALPTITATASPGPYNPDRFTPFLLTAFRNPSDYWMSNRWIIDTIETNVLFDSDSLQILDGSDDTRILLKSCMDKCVVVKLPVTGQRNANLQIEQDLEEGDLIKVRMYIPRANSVDIYCHRESLRVMGIGEDIF
jgi:hypothetical protein